MLHRPPATPPSSQLPSFIIPCPACAGRMVFHSLRLATPEFGLDDTVYACQRCGTELIRTTAGKPAKGVAAA